MNLSYKWHVKALQKWITVSCEFVFIVSLIEIPSLKTEPKSFLCSVKLVQQKHGRWTWGVLFYIYSGLKRQQNIFSLNFRFIFGTCPNVFPYFLSREFLGIVVFSAGLKCFTWVVSYRFSFFLKFVLLLSLFVLSFLSLLSGCLSPCHCGF